MVDLVARLNMSFIYTQSYTDDIATLITHRWHTEHKANSMSVNPDKSILVPFTNKRNFGQHERITQFGPYLLVMLKSNREDVNTYTKKCMTGVYRRDCKTNSGLWVCSVVVKIVVMSSIIKMLNKVQHMACTAITRAIKNSPTAEMEQMLSLLSLPL